MAAERESNESPLPVPEALQDVPEAKKRKLNGTQLPCPSASADNEGQLEVEVVQADEMAFLDGVTHLAILKTELKDVRKELMLQRNQDEYIPLNLFRPWSHRVLSVTDLTSGTWCEVQVEYRHLYPHLKKTREWKRMTEKGSPVALKTETMKKGSDVHMKKELEVHDIVKVESVTKEDRMAVQLINTYAQLATIKAGKIERELFVFGDPCDQGILVRGVIDQLQFSPENDELILTDNKTRRTKSIPGPNQKMGTRLQLMLYKYLLDYMLLGITKSALLYDHLHLNQDACLTRGPLDFIQNSGLGALFWDAIPNACNSGSRPVLTQLKFGTVVDCIMTRIAGLNLPIVGSLMVLYEHQGTGEVLGVDSIEYDEQWMKDQVENSLKFWGGERTARGADIEDTTWKCGSCQFREICVWRLNQELENSPAAKHPPQE